MSFRSLLNCRFIPAGRSVAAACLTGTALSVVAAGGLIDPSRLAAQEGTLQAVPPQPSAIERMYQQGDYPKVIELADQQIARDATDHIAYYFRGSAKVELGLARGDTKMIRSGVEDAREALKHGGVSQTNYYLPYLYGMTSLSRVEGRKEHAEVSVKIANQVLTRTGIAPDSKANIHYQKGQALLVLRQPDDAAAEFEAGIALLPNHLGARLGLADAYVLSGKPAEAERAFTDAARVFPNNPLVFNNRGMFYQQQQKFDQAVEAFTQALAGNPQFAIAATNRGFARLSSGRPAEAEKDFDLAIQLDPNQPVNYSLRGAAKLTQGRIADARADFEVVLRLDPRNGIAKADVGFTYFFARDYNNAVKAFDEAIALDPSLNYLSPWTYWALNLKGQAADALSRYESAWKKPAAERNWTEHLLAFLAGQEDEATLAGQAGASDANLKTPQLCEAYYFSGEKRRVAGDAAGAMQLYQRAMDTQTRALAAYRGALFASGQTVPR